MTLNFFVRNVENLMKIAEMGIKMITDFQFFR